VITAVHQLALIANDDLIAGTLNRNGLVTGHGNRWTRGVTSLRSHHRISVLKPADNGSSRGSISAMQRAQRMRNKIDDGGFETPYRLRKQVVEPVLGQIKQARGFRQFLLRGVEKVRAEWAMICTAHNFLKLFTLAIAARAGYPATAVRHGTYLDGLLIVQFSSLSASSRDSSSSSRNSSTTGHNYQQLSSTSSPG